MSCKNYDFAIIGGDLRQIYMAKELADRGCSVLAYGLDGAQLNDACPISESLWEAVTSCKYIILPIPVSKDGKTILSCTKQADLNLEELCRSLNPSHKLYGGCFTKDLKYCCETKGIPFCDLMEEEEIVLYNTIATAEGAIAEAIQNSTINLHGSSCLIIGYGRCARTLADKLKFLCGHTDIAARSSHSLAAAYAASFGTVPFSELEERLSQYDYIFNTVPALVLTGTMLKKTKPEALIIDIASAPGGVDFSCAKAMERNARLCLGLPGKYAPKSSAGFLVSYLLSHIRKEV